MKISIFSKFEMSGGSEFRCVELANGIKKYTDHEAFLLCEKKLPEKLYKHILPQVNVIENCFLSPEYFYNSDRIIIVNSDSPDFSTLDYWLGRSPRHNNKLEIEKIKNKKIFFLYNFIVSPARHLNELINEGLDIGIIAANTKFFDEITKQDRYEDVRNLPRYILESPIDPFKLNIFTRPPKEIVTFGMHSKSLGNKWNKEFPNLIEKINKRYGHESIFFRFMGIPGDLKSKMTFPNTTCLNEDEESVKDFLSKLDVFLFFPDWGREEPWARVIAEAMVSGCPVVALEKGGTSDQILKYNNGFLCKKFDDFYKYIVYILEHKSVIQTMSKNSLRISKNFYSESVTKKLMNILGQTEEVKWE